MRNSFKFEINKSHPLRDGFLFKEITIVAKEISIVVIRDDRHATHKLTLVLFIKQRVR